MYQLSVGILKEEGFQEMEKKVWMNIIHCTVKLLRESLIIHAVRFVECDCCSKGVSSLLMLISFYTENC